MSSNPGTKRTRAKPGQGLNPKPAKYRGDYHVRSRRLTRAAHADPTTRCWRCGRTLTEARAEWGPQVTWHAGHVETEGRELRPEDSHCNQEDRNRRHPPPWASTPPPPTTPTTPRSHPW